MRMHLVKCKINSKQNLHMDAPMFTCLLEYNQSLNLCFIIVFIYIEIILNKQDKFVKSGMNNVSVAFQYKCFDK